MVTAPAIVKGVTDVTSTKFGVAILFSYYPNINEKATALPLVATLFESSVIFPVTAKPDELMLALSVPAVSNLIVSSSDDSSTCILVSPSASAIESDEPPKSLTKAFFKLVESDIS